MLEVANNPKIRLMTYAEIKSVNGNIGNFEVVIEKKPRYVLESKCNACGECTEVCPVYRPNEFDCNLGARKAIYRSFTQAVPSTFIIDMDSCIQCGLCKRVCDHEAIDYDMQIEYETINVGIIIVAPGFKIFDPHGLFGYGKYKNVLTQLELERLIAPNGPTLGELIRPSDKKHPKKIFMIQCVGSRSLRTNLHCSSGVCCMVGIKNASLIKQHNPDAEIYIAYMDIRAAGKNYEEYYLNSRELGIKFIRGNISKIKELDNDNLFIKIENTLMKTILDLEVDLVILSVAMVPPNDIKKISDILKLEQGRSGFLKEYHDRLDPVSTKVPGIYLCGAVQGPKSIADSVTQGKAAASLAKIPINNGFVELRLIKAIIDPDRCSKCGLCVEICPYNALTFGDNGIPVVNEIICKGCGTCVSICRSESVTLRYYRNKGFEEYIDGVFQIKKTE
ncbi:MAG: 4Fe-4S binding protein [Candidatus Helarchaeota archaeon]